MNPALSVIFFTTASGGGYFLLALMGVLGAAGLLPADRAFGLVGFIFGLGMVSAGLLSSTFHLGHPERAWRCFSNGAPPGCRAGCWRSSPPAGPGWLSAGSCSGRSHRSLACSPHFAASPPSARRP